MKILKAFFERGGILAESRPIDGLALAAAIALVVYAAVRALAG
jgi:hypothetical protein